LEEELGEKTSGLDLDHLAERSWFVNVLYTVKPEHSFFQYSQAQSKQEQMMEKKLKV